MNYSEIVEIFKQNANEKYDNFNNKIINSGVKTLGCTIPFVRSVAKKCGECLNEVLAFPVNEFYEVDLLKGIVVSSAKLSFEEKAPLLRAFADTIENWAVCDSSTVKAPKCERQKYFEFFCEFCRSEKEFVCRYGLVNLMANYLDEEHIDGVFGALKSVVAQGAYYVDMAMAWLVATAMAKCRGKTVWFMENEGREVLNVFAYNKALQKMRDSFRVSVADKEWTKTLKRGE